MAAVQRRNRLSVSEIAVQLKKRHRLRLFHGAQFHPVLQQKKIQRIGEKVADLPRGQAALLRQKAAPRQLRRREGEAGPHVERQTDHASQRHPCLLHLESLRLPRILDDFQLQPVPRPGILVTLNPILADGHALSLHVVLVLVFHDNAPILSDGGLATLRPRLFEHRFQLVVQILHTRFLRAVKIIRRLFQRIPQ